MTKIKGPTACPACGGRGWIATSREKALDTQIMRPCGKCHGTGRKLRSSTLPSELRSLGGRFG